MSIIGKRVFFKRPENISELWGTVLDKTIMADNGVSITMYLVKAIVKKQNDEDQTPEETMILLIKPNSILLVE